MGPFIVKDPMMMLRNGKVLYIYGFLFCREVCNHFAI